LCWVTGAAAGASAGANDVDGGVTSLWSPVFSLVGVERAFLGYWFWYTNDLGSDPGTDRFRVDVSNDGGASWVELESVSESESRWRFHQIFLPDHILPTGQMRLRFVASDLGAASLVEAALDDVAVLGLPAADADLDGTADGLDNCPAAFNPGQLDADQDGTGDVCDCAPADAAVSATPGEVGPTLAFLDTIHAQWLPILEASGYNVYRGQLPTNGSSTYDHVCFAAGLAMTELTDEEPPPAGAASYYLVTGANCFGEGSPGTSSDMTPRSLPSPCP
jgi:hypothetical protein